MVPEAMAERGREMHKAGGVGRGGEHADQVSGDAISAVRSDSTAPQLAAPPQLAGDARRGRCRRISEENANGGGILRHRRGMLVLGAVILVHVMTFATLLGSAHGQATSTGDAGQTSTLDGIYRYGQLTWEQHGDGVEIVLQTAFRRSSNNELFQGTAPDGLAAVGDVLTLYGKEPPQLLYGDESVATVLRMTVTSYSVMEDWVMGELRLKHTYATPNNQGRPWLVQYVGCCRLSTLTNNADKNWAVTAEIDLLAATRSPRAATLPMMSVPIADMDGGLPSVYIPTQEARGMEWGEGKPFYVGTVLALSGGAYLSVPLAAAASVVGCADDAAGRGCLWELLRADSGLSAESAVTIEGWVKPNATAGGYAAAAVDEAMATLLVHVGGSYVTVGHDWAGGARVQAKFLLPGDVTGKWVHVAVRRTIKATVCPVDDRRRNVQYHVWADGVAVWEEGLGLLETSDYCGPHRREGEAALLRTGQLLFGAGNVSGGAGTLEGHLDEWRVWNGAVTETDIRERMNELITPAKEAFLGDPTTATQPLLALWHMDPPEPCDAAACEVAAVVPLYPKQDATGLAATKMGPGKAMTAEPDSTGVMGWESVVAEVLAGAHGLVTLDPRHGPGLYQVTLSLALSGGRARVGLDFVVTVLDAAWDAAEMKWKLCGASGAACAQVGNEWVPSLAVRGFVRAGPPGECGAQMAPPTPGVAPLDLAPLAFPCTLTAFAGFDFRLSLAAHDPQEGTVGFNFGALPAGMRLAVEATGSEAAMGVHWLPCAAAVGLHAVCLDAADRHGNGTVRAASSPMTCLQLNVTRDPPPMFDAAPGRTPTTLAPLTMGEEVRVELWAADANCLDAVAILPAADPDDAGADAAAPLPPGAMLHAPQPATPPQGMCVGTSRVMTWTPSYNHGGWSGRVCFAAVDSGGGCEGAQGQRTVHCVEVSVRRCVYALQAQQQLQEVAAMFGTDWMRLWSLNAALIHPDLIMWSGGPARQTLNVGHLYQAAAAETAGQVAERMGMSMGQLHTLNFDIEGDTALARGQHLCVMPNSCTGKAGTHYSQVKYRDDAFFVQYKGDGAALPEPPLQTRQEP